MFKIRGDCGRLQIDFLSVQLFHNLSQESLSSLLFGNLLSKGYTLISSCVKPFDPPMLEFTLLNELIQSKKKVETYNLG